MKRFICLIAFLISGNLVYGAADLEIGSLRGLPGDPYKIEFRFMNHGPDAANNPACNIYFYAHERLLLSEAVKLPAIASGAARTDQLSLTLPEKNVTTIKVEVFDSQQPDLQPSTNFMEVNIKSGNLRKADLQIVDVKPNTEKGKGVFLVRLRNNGPARVLPSRVNVELEVFGEVIARDAKRVDRVDASQEIETRIQIPDAPVVPATNGVLYVRWENPEVDDSEPANNVYKVAVPLVLRMPDLLPIKPAIDRQGILTFAINNKGNARAAASITALYINGALVERYNTPEMAPRGSSQFKYKSTKLTADDKVVIVADFNADVPEASEENNRLN